MTIALLLRGTMLVFAGLAMAVGCLRVASAWTDTWFFQATGAEATGIYGILKLLNGDRLYHSLQDHPATFLFNYAFYYVYAGAAGLVASVAPSVGIPAGVHLVTCGAAAFFAAVLGTYLTRTFDRSSHSPRDVIPTVISLACITFFGPFVGWWYVAARPDLVATGLEMSAVVLVLWRHEPSNRLRTIAAATVLFGAAWSFKQTTVLAWLGCMTFWGLTRQWRAVFVSGLVMTTAVAVPFVLWGPAYVEHAIWAPSVSPWLWQQALGVAREAALTGGYILGPALLVSWIPLPPRDLPSRRRLFELVVLAIVTIGSAVAAGKEGSARNYWLSTYLISAVLIGPAILRIATQNAGRRSLRIGITVCMLAGAGLASLYLVFPGRVGNTDLASTAQIALAARLRDDMAAANKPLFVSSAYDALPWLSGQYPSDVVDWTFYNRAKTGNRVLSIHRKIDAKDYATGFVLPGEWADVFKTAGYVQDGTSGVFLRFKRPD